MVRLNLDVGGAISNGQWAIGSQESEGRRKKKEDRRQKER